MESSSAGNNKRLRSKSRETDYIIIPKIREIDTDFIRRSIRAEVILD